MEENDDRLRALSAGKACVLSFALGFVVRTMEQGMVRVQASDITTTPVACIARAFERALELARVYEGATAPNPPVGCVLLDRDGNELAAGAHRKAGTLHAEAIAIAEARAAAIASRIHTVVVTLEPCNHQGRTPACAEAIINTPARQIWIACRDPNPLVAGGGAARLAEAGLDVRFLADLDTANSLALARDAARLIAPFGKHARTGMPFVTVKQALSRTGDMIPPPGQKTFTAPASLTLAHNLRRRADAILTGSGTVLADQPEFTVRLVPDHLGKQRTLVVLDRRRRVPARYREAARQRGFVVQIADDLDAALADIGAAGALEVLVEAGPTLTATVLKSGLWDEHVVIEHGAEVNGDDRVTIRRGAGTDPTLIEKDHNVFRDH
jgi:diaminohydroxyphosphoribosylaminopyrimidine deaminase/5-amino-6-(5-phosphoribosylamino)uracil reductase